MANNYLSSPASKLLKEFGAGISAMKFNKLAQADGFLEKKTRESTSVKGKVKTYWSLTDKGLEFGRNMVSDRNPKEVTPRWYDNKFDELLDILANK